MDGEKQKLLVYVIEENPGSCFLTAQDAFIGVEAETKEELFGEIITAVNFTFENQGHIYSADDLTFIQARSGFFPT